MQTSPLGNTGLSVTPLGYGAFKIGRNQGIKYPSAYDLPDDDTTERLLNNILDLGINLIDTAPAYGVSEERIGRFISHRRDEFVLSTKVGETFEDGESTYDFSGDAVRDSIDRSRRRLQTDCLDLVFIHSDGNDLAILNETDCVETLLDLKSSGVIQAVGFSGKTVAGATAALDWADCLMVEYHLEDRSHEELIASANDRGVGILVKKGLASGHLPPPDAIRFVLDNPAVSSLVVGGLNIDHWRSNVMAANEIRPR